MNAYDYNAVCYDGDIYCVGCLPAGVSPESGKVHPIFANSEWGCYPTCAACGRVHSYVILLGQTYSQGEVLIVPICPYPRAYFEGACIVTHYRQVLHGQPQKALHEDMAQILAALHHYYDYTSERKFDSTPSHPYTWGACVDLARDLLNNDTPWVGNNSDVRGIPPHGPTKE